MATGTYFDGQRAKPRSVTFDFAAGDTLRVEGDEVALQVPMASVRVSDRLGDIPRFIYLPDAALIETSENAEIDTALQRHNRARGARLIHLLETHRAVAAIACALLAVLITIGGYFGPPALARLVARRVPHELDARLGQASLATIAPYFSKSTLTPAERARVSSQLRRLRADTPTPDLPRLEFRSMNGGLPNAFALPGNVIVMTDELVRLPATNDELAAVLAHELAHLDHRHGLQGLLRNSFALLIVTTVTGDLSTLTSFAAAIPLSILTKGYSRDLEREADRAALAALRARGIEAQRFTSVLVKLETAQQALARNSTYLSTHPSSEERTALFGALSAEAALVLADATAEPVPIARPAPYYPLAMRRMNVEGEVLLEFVVGVQGNTREIKVIRSTRREFDAPAIAAVERWTFQPGRENFRVIEKRLQVPIQFHLDATPPPATPP
jgi:TonB family protein